MESAPKLLLRKNWMIKAKSGVITDDYILSKGKDLGSGAFGVVQLALHKLTRQKRAIKRILKHRVRDASEFMK
jgi:calcium-dependent protein kinase